MNKLKKLLLVLSLAFGINNLLSQNAHMLSYYCSGGGYYLSAADYITIYSGSGNSYAPAGNYVITVFDSAGTQLAQHNLTQSSNQTNVKFSDLGISYKFNKPYLVNIGNGSIGSYTAGTTTCSVLFKPKTQIPQGYCGGGIVTLSTPVYIFESTSGSLASDSNYPSGYGISIYAVNSNGTQGSLISTYTNIPHASNSLTWFDLGLVFNKCYYINIGAYQDGVLIPGISTCEICFEPGLEFNSYYCNGVSLAITTPANIYEGGGGYATDSYYPSGYAFSIYATNSNGSQAGLISTYTNVAHSITGLTLSDLGLKYNTCYRINVGMYLSGVLIPSKTTCEICVAPCTNTVVATNLTHTNTTCQLANGSVSSSPSGGTSPYTYSWNTTPTNTTSAVSNISSGNYTVTITDAKNCVTTGTVAVTNSFTPTTPTISPSTATFCSGASTTFTANGVSTYTWSPSGSLSSATGATVTATPTTSTIYTVSGTNSSGCIATQTATTTVNPLPTLTVTLSSNSICIGGSSTFTASGASTYFWSPSSSLSSTTGATVTATPTATTTYSIIGTDVNSCVNSTTFSLTVNPIPQTTITKASICLGGSATLVASMASTYTWSPTTGLSSTTGATVTATPTTTTIYTVTGSSLGCTLTTTTSVKVYSNNVTVQVSSLDSVLTNDTLSYIISSQGFSYTVSPGIDQSFCIPLSTNDTGLVPVTILFFGKNAGDTTTVFYYLNSSNQIVSLSTISKNYSTGRIDTLALDSSNFNLRLTSGGVNITFSSSILNLIFASSQVYATMQRSLDASYFIVKNGGLLFKYDEDYADKDKVLTYTIYDAYHNTIVSTKNNSAKLYPVRQGDNRYNMNLEACNFTPNGPLNSGMYLLEVENEKKEKWFLRIQNNVLTHINCSQNNNGNSNH